MKTKTTKSFILGMMPCFSLTVLPAKARAQTDQEQQLEETRKAAAALVAAIPKAAKDPYRPMFHFRPPAQWMSDICGSIYYNGYHHIFYQSNPYQDDMYGWGWGHARSKDLVKWEELPFALVPVKHRGERRCNSGNIALDGDGTPMIFYTWVPQNEVPRSQWAALPLDDDLMNWRRVGDKPLMERGKDGIPADVPGDWSDPYVFKEKDRTFVTFKACSGLVCEAQDKTLTKWKFVGRMDGLDGECPNVFKLQDKWVIVRSTDPLSVLTGALVLEGDHAIRFDADGPPLTMDYG